MNTFTADFKQLMDGYDTLRAKWLSEFGNDKGFDLWFREQLIGGK